MHPEGNRRQKVDSDHVAADPDMLQQRQYERNGLDT
jgi:hypothetical protein